MQIQTLITPILGLILAPLLFGIINKTKALFGGRLGLPILQPYRDLFKLLRKGAVYSTATTWIFRAGPILGVAVTMLVLSMIPLGRLPVAVSFSGDLILAVYLLGLMRFFTMLAAMDTASAFEGMGASREAQFSVLAEPAMLLALASLAKLSGAWSLGDISLSISSQLWLSNGPALILIVVGLFIVLLAENCRIPVDDPNTHLELTMIHEVMVLDHSGVDFGFIQYAASLKLWIFSALIVSILLPMHGASLWLDGGFALFGMAVVAVAVGVVESCMPRFSFLKVPQLLVGASVFSVVSLMIQ